MISHVDYMIVLKKINNIKRKQKKASMEDETLRSQFVVQLGNDLVQKMLNNPNLTFLQARDFAIRWIHTEGGCYKSVNQFHVYAMQRNAKSKEDVAESNCVKNIQGKMKQLTNDSEKYGEWMLSMH